MKFSASISAVIISVLIARIMAEVVLCEDDGDFNICHESGVIKFINKTGENPDLTIDFRKYKSIAPRTLQNLNIDQLELIFGSESNCVPKLIDWPTETESLFQGLLTVRHLIIKCGYFHLDSNPFKFMKSINFLKMVAGGYNQVPQNFMTDLRELKTIYLSGNNITTITNHSFSAINHQQITSISLNRSNVSTVAPGTFNKFNHLTSLSLMENQIGDLVPEMFHGLHNLEKLYLNGNNIRILRRNVFINLPRLRFLHLDHNEIRQIELGAFTGLNNIEYLILRSNNMENLPPRVFDDLRNLVHLDLSENMIRTVSTRLFNGFTNLSELLLNNNNIQHIESDAFYESTITHLDLSHNSINSLHSGKFTNSEINQLDISKNNMTSIAPEALGSLKFSLHCLTLDNSVSGQDHPAVWGLDESLTNIISVK